MFDRIKRLLNRNFQLNIWCSPSRGNPNKHFSCVVVACGTDSLMNISQELGALWVICLEVWMEISTYYYYSHDYSFNPFRNSYLDYYYNFFFKFFHSFSQNSSRVQGRTEFIKGFSSSPKFPSRVFFTNFPPLLTH